MSRMRAWAPNGSPCDTQSVCVVTILFLQLYSLSTRVHEIASKALNCGLFYWTVPAGIQVRRSLSGHGSTATMTVRLIELTQTAATYSIKVSALQYTDTYCFSEPFFAVCE